VWGVALIGFRVVSGLALGHLRSRGLRPARCCGLRGILGHWRFGDMVRRVPVERSCSRRRPTNCAAVAGRVHRRGPGGPRLADAVHGAAAAVVGTTVAAAGGGVLVVVGVVLAAMVRCRVRPLPVAEGDKV